MRYVLSDEQITELAFQAGGAATRPLLEDHPDYVFPSERVQDAVQFVVDHLKRGFTPSSEHEFAAYLDSSIRFWRGLRDGTAEPLAPLTAEEAAEKAPQYIDALQSARVSLLGRQLP